MSAWNQQSKGITYCLIGCLAVTPAALLIREVNNLSEFQVMFWQYFLMTITLFLVLCYFEKFQVANAFLSLGWVGLFSSIIWAINNFTLVYSLQTTAAANSLVILAANPLFSALGSVFILKETIPCRTIIASLICFLSIVLIFYGDLTSSDGGSQVVSLICAVVASLTQGLYFVFIRYASLNYK